MRDLVRVRGERGRGTGVEATGSGNVSETGSVTENEENKKQRPVSAPASPRISGIKRRTTTSLDRVKVTRRQVFYGEQL